MALTVNSNTNNITPDVYGYDVPSWADFLHKRWAKQLPTLRVAKIEHDPLPNVKHEWAISPVGNLATYLTSAASASATSITVNDASLINVGDVISIGGIGDSNFEVVRVSAKSSNTLTVDALSNAHSTGEVVAVVNRTQIYGDNPTATPIEDISGAYNYVQEFTEKVALATINNDLQQPFGMSNARYALEQAAHQLAVKLNRAILLGERVQPAAGTAGQMGGVKYLIDTYSGIAVDSTLVSTPSTITYDKLCVVVEAIEDNGGFSNGRGFIIANPRGARLLHQMLVNANSSVLEVGGEDTTGLGYSWIGVNDVRFDILVDRTLIDPAASGSTRTATGVLFFLSPVDAIGKYNIRLKARGNSIQDAVKFGKLAETNMAAQEYQFLAHITLELGEPHMHGYWAGITNYG